MARSRTPTNKQITDEAAQWYVEWNTGDPGADARAAFDAWLRRSPEHVRAYLDVFKIWETLPSAARENLGSAAEVIERSLLDSSVVSLREGDRSEPASGIPVAWSARLPWIACAAGIVVVCCAIGIWSALRSNIYTTGIGEQKILRLADGSEVELNARTKIHVSLDKSERKIELVSGQALFRVEKDERRPFIVAAADMKVRALGTQFDVHLKRSGATVTVVDGRVAVAPRAFASSALDTTGKAPGPGTEQTRPIQVDAGQQLTVSASGAARAEKADVASVTAWREHRLVFSSAPLAEVVDEFNRYNERQLVIVSSVLDDLNVNAIFSATDLPALLRFLREQQEIQIEESDREIRISNAVR